MNDRQPLVIAQSLEAPDGAIIEVLQYRTLEGSADIRTAKMLFHANQSGMKLKMVRIRLNGGSVRVEPGLVYTMKGNLSMRTGTGGGIVKGLVRKMTVGEKFFINEIQGTGEIYLEPSFGHFLLHRIEAGEGGVIVDQGLFYAGTASLDIGAVRQKHLSAAIFGGEGLFQTKITGTGIAVIYSPVPAREIQKFRLTGDKLWVDGNFALMRSATVSFRTEKSSKSWFSTSVSGEGLMQTFQGEGYVWVAPTQGVYQRLTTAEGLASLAIPPHIETLKD